MPYFLGNYEEEEELRVSLIYYNEPPQTVKDSYDVMIQGEEPTKESFKGKQAILYADTAIEEIYYKYIDRPLTQEELTQEQLGWIAKISTKNQVLEGLLTEEELIKLGELYPEWEIGKEYAGDDVIAYQNELYRIIQTHTSQADWLPNTTASLYNKVAPAGVIPAWIQPTGAHNSYSLDAQVTHDGKIWQSNIDANTYEPGVYGWTEI